jgi:hypothetical protein
MSLLHSLAYSALRHTQWKIGPVSEASIGNVMLHASPGFITLADTPTLGTVEMIGEDAADRYLIMGLENRTANGYLIALARTFLNPGRSFANVMAFRLPWHRENRIGLNVDEHRMRKELIAEYKAGGEKPFEYVRPAQVEFEREYPKEARDRVNSLPGLRKFHRTRQLCWRWRFRSLSPEPQPAARCRAKRMSHHGHASLQSEWRLIVLWWWNPLDSTSGASCLTVCTGDDRGQEGHSRNRRHCPANQIV